MIVRFFTWKRLKKIYDAKLIFLSFATFFVLIIFWSGAKQRFCFRESMPVLDQNGRIQALGFLARWRLTSHALYYKIPYWGCHYLVKTCLFSIDALVVWCPTWSNNLYLVQKVSVFKTFNLKKVCFSTFWPFHWVWMWTGSKLLVERLYCNTL